ncbi:type II toxin-antitoxin system VapC family toxin [Candidatus Poribacteria bacterium]|nr:type II toxin-antitoxin system VapC family toxin [Candidatus Poribacteria bacterium]
MKRRMLDTDTLSLFLRKEKTVIANANAYHAHFKKLTISIISEYEIRRGLEYKGATTQQAQFETFLNDSEVLDFSKNACQIAAHIYAQLRHAGTLISDADILIAAITLVNDCVLVTNNEKHFNQILGLTIENWKTKPPN